MNYFIQSNGETVGPLSGEQVRLRLVEQGLKASDLVRSEDSEEWTPLGSFANFRDAALPQSPIANPLAIVSAVLAVAAILLLIPGVALGLPLPSFLLASIPAIVCGHLAVRKIGYSFSNVPGYPLARMGLFTGYIITLAIPVAIALITPTYQKVAEKAPLSKAINNCRQVVITLRLYSPDHGGKYPDAAEPEVRGSNEAFHRLFVEGIANDEQIFGAPLSPYQPDGKIGDAPLFLEALKPGENHWAITKGLTDSDSSFYPLVYENPRDASWPPKWNANAQETPKPGRVWSGGKILIGMNDGSVTTHAVDLSQGEHAGLKSDAKGKDEFTQNEKPLSVLNVAR